MARFWDDNDANGKKLTDGRVCLVITSDTDSAMPAIRTYGKDKEEVLEKLADTTRTAQETIHRLRTKPAPASSPSPVSATVTAAEVTAASADLSNPQKAVQAARVLMKANGIDVDAEAQRQAAVRMAEVAQEWERNNPDFPHDERNQRLLVDRAIILAGGRLTGVTAQHFDRAFQQMSAQNLFFEPEQKAPPVHPDGNPDSRTEAVRTATSYKRNSLRQESPAPASVKEESAKIKEWRRVADRGNTRELADAIKNDRGFREWMDKEYAKSA